MPKKNDFITYDDVFPEVNSLLDVHQSGRFSILLSTVPTISCLIKNLQALAIMNQYNTEQTNIDFVDSSSMSTELLSSKSSSSSSELSSSSSSSSSDQSSSSSSSRSLSTLSSQSTESSSSSSSSDQSSLSSSSSSDPIIVPSSSSSTE